MGILFCQNVMAQFTYEFQHFNSANTPTFTTNNFHCIGIGKENRYWAGSQYGGLYKFDDALQVWIKSSRLTNVFINDIKTDANGGIWVAQSGTQGSVGGASSIAGGINYFPDEFDVSMLFYSVPGTTTGGGLPSRNVRSIHVDTVSIVNPADKLPRVWAAMNTYFSGGSSTPGGIVAGLNPTANFFNTKRKGLQIIPYAFTNGTPNCDAIGGDDKEIWTSVRTNFGGSQIIRNHVSGSENSYLGRLTTQTDSVLVPGFRVNAIFFDRSSRKWLGMANGGILVNQAGSWKTMNDPDLLPPGTQVNNNAICSDQYGYIYIGTNNGLLIFNDGGEIDDRSSYTRLTTDDDLMHNNVTGLAYDKKYGRILITSPAGVSFMTVKYKIDVSMQWDNSWPFRVGNPYGVAADGVSRIYLKVKKGQQASAGLKNVEVSLHDLEQGTESTRGRLKAASYLNLLNYSEEANTGTSTTVFREDDNFVDGDNSFWFWYKAPDDFSKDAGSEFKNLAKRFDHIKVKVTFTDNSVDSLIYKIRVVRPPLLMVHGLASGPDTWFNLRHNNSVYFMDSYLWEHKRALVMSGRNLFVENAKLLLGGDLGIDTAKDNMNTLQGNINYMRSLGYACNQVDYLCHSMGGIMIRMAIGTFPDKYYAGEGSSFSYKNYNQGFTHKIITVNTPHNSSPVADLVDEFMPQAPPIITELFSTLYQVMPRSQIPFDFIDPVIGTGVTRLPLRMGIIPIDIEFDVTKITGWVASPAVKNLQINDYRRGVRAGVNLKETNEKHHMIYGVGHFMQISELNTERLREQRPIIQFTNQILDILIYSPAIPPVIKEGLVAMRGLGTVASAIAFWEWYCNELGFPNYLANSDLIVPELSQVARIQFHLAQEHVTRFTGKDAMHTSILARDDVGDRILDLLNSSIHSNLYANTIPANDDPDPGTIGTYNESGSATTNNIELLESGTTNYGKTRIEITSPSSLANLNTGDNVQVNFVLKNISNHLYTRIILQTGDSVNTTKTLNSQSFSFTVDEEMPGTQYVYAIAAYANQNNSVDYYIDTIPVTVTNPNPLQGFRLMDRILEAKGNVPTYPRYQVKYNDNWINLPANAGVAVHIESPDIAEYAPAGFILGMKDGFTPAIFQFGGFSDTILIEATKPFGTYCQNKTISNGNFSDPAIWSEGRVPAACDVVTIEHNVTCDTNIHIHTIVIETDKTLTILKDKELKLGNEIDDGSTFLLNFGNLINNGGTIDIKGRAKAYPGSQYQMNGGKLIINGAPEFDID